MYPFLVENMADEEAHIQNLNIEVNSKEVCYFMCGENFGRILQILPERYAYSEISGTSILI